MSRWLIFCRNQFYYGKTNQLFDGALYSTKVKPKAFCVKNENLTEMDWILENRTRKSHTKQKENVPLPAGYLRLAVPSAVEIKGVFLGYLLCPSVWSRSRSALAPYLLPESQSDVSALTHFCHQFKLRKQARTYMYICISWTILAVWEVISGKGTGQRVRGDNILNLERKHS